MAEGALICAATAAAKAVAQLVSARALDEIKLGWGFKGELEKLNEKFEYIQAFLEDVSNNYSNYAQKSKLVSLWVQKVKDAAYLADDVIDEYAVEIFRRKMEINNNVDEFCNFFTPSNHVIFHLGMAHKVKDILSMFDEIDKEARVIGINQVDMASTSVSIGNSHDRHLSQSRQHAAADASDFVGREDDVEKLLEFVCGPKNDEGLRRLSTVAVVGMGGMGKTTLTRHLYDHERTCANFSDKKIWITVSQNFDIVRILNEMVQSVTSNTSELSNTDAIIRKLEEELKGKKLLLVFDDVWNDDHDSWSCLKGLLHKIGTVPGSVIIVNTRSDEVAKATEAVLKLKIEGLSKCESWSLFHRIISYNNTRPINLSLEDVGKMIVKKCKGVPLSIKAIGGLLQSKKYLHEWESIAKSELWDLLHGQNKILPSLLLSFNHLPSPSVKQCFAYHAMFPKGNYVYKSELIGAWLSQGYLRDDKRGKFIEEEIGDKNLKILVNNSLLEEYVPKGQEVVCYKMHDLVNDLAVYVCGSELMKEDVRETSSCRHLVFTANENKGFPWEKALTKLRTLRLTGTFIPWNMLIHATYLRTLKLDHTGIKELPPAVGSLKHLRLLDVSHNPISTLPTSIGKLYQLQTLILHHCPKMKKLPEVVNKLVNLRHISTTASMFAWKGLRQLTNLQSLPYLSLDNDTDGWSIDELGDLLQLRDKICIEGLEWVTDRDQAKKVALSEKTKVLKLTFCWTKDYRDVSETGGGICDEDVLEDLEPHPFITSLELRFFNGVRFPAWITGMDVITKAPRVNRAPLSDLTVVKLMYCSRCQTLPRLGQLPLLKCLILSALDVEVIDTDFYGGDGMIETVSFPSLEELEISGFRRLTTWMQPPLAASPRAGFNWFTTQFQSRRAAFPRLETLRINGCALLKSVPELGITSLKSLNLGPLGNVESVDFINNNIGLTSLVMYMMPKISSLPEKVGNCHNLQILDLAFLDKLTSLPRGLELLISLQSLRVSHCTSLNSVQSDVLRSRHTLHKFQIQHCPSLRKIPTGLEECTLLESLQITKCPRINSPPTDISKWRSLWNLDITCRSADHLKSMLKSAKNLQFLRRLVISGFRDDNELRDYFSDITLFLHLQSLTELKLSGLPKIKTLPQQLGLLTRITSLCFSSFRDLEEIPDWICNIESLNVLRLEHCNNLKRLPSKDVLCRLLNLISLEIAFCRELSIRYAKDKGSEWHNISHIKQVTVNFQTYRIDE